MKHANLTFVICGLALVAVASAQPDPKKILADAQAVFRALKSLEYTISSDFANEQVDATVWMKFSKVPDSGFMPGMYRVKGKSSDGTVLDFAYDGKAMRLRRRDGDITIIDSPTAYELGQQLPPAAMSIGLVSPPNIYSSDVKPPTLTYKGEATVGKWKCDLIEIRRLVKDPTLTERTLESTVAYDRKSHLPVQFRSSFGVRTIKSFTIDPALEDRIFRMEGKEIKAARGGPYTEKLLPVGTWAPNFTLKDGQGKSRSLLDYRGKVVVLDFWGTWCIPCRKTMPILQDLHKKYGPKGLAVIGVSIAEEGSSVNFMKQMGLTYQLLREGDKVLKLYKGELLPTLYVIDKAGKIAFRQAGVGQDDRLQLTKVVEGLLKR